MRPSLPKYLKYTFTVTLTVPDFLVITDFHVTESVRMCKVTVYDSQS